MTVPTVTVNGFRQELHWYMPARCDLPLTSVVSPTTPQCGQIGLPSGQCNASKWARDASSLWKIGSVRLTDISLAPMSRTMTERRYYVKCIIAFSVLG